MRSPHFALKSSICCCAVVLFGCNRQPSVVGTWKLDPEIFNVKDPVGDPVLSPEMQKGLEASSIQFRSDGTLTSKKGPLPLLPDQKVFPASTDDGIYTVNGNTIDLTINYKDSPRREQWILSGDGKKLNAYNSPTDTNPMIWVRR